LGNGFVHLARHHDAHRCGHDSDRDAERRRFRPLILRAGARNSGFSGDDDYAVADLGPIEHGLCVVPKLTNATT
jgi:hypothetical protein